MTAEIISCSGAVLININVICPPGDSPFHIVQKLALHHLPCIRQLIILDADMYKFTLTLRTSPAPHLETLVLDDNTWVLPSDIFKSEAPHLRLLILWGCKLQWDSYLLSSMLTYLALRCRVHSPLSTVLMVLRNLSNLEILVLEHSLPEGDVAMISLPSSDRTVTMAHLRVLELHGGARHIASFVEHLHAPQLEEVQLVCLDTHCNPPASIKTILSMISKHSLGIGFDQERLSIRLDFIIQAVKTSKWLICLLAITSATNLSKEGTTSMVRKIEVTLI